MRGLRPDERRLKDGANGAGVLEPPGPFAVFLQPTVSGFERLRLAAPHEIPDSPRPSSASGLRPGKLIHVDPKKLGRIDGIGRRLTSVGAKTADIAPGSPWDNGYVESSDARLRDELLNGETLFTLKEAPIVTGSR